MICTICNIQYPDSFYDDISYQRQGGPKGSIKILTDEPICPQCIKEILNLRMVGIGQYCPSQDREMEAISKDLRIKKKREEFQAKATRNRA